MEPRSQAGAPHNSGGGELLHGSFRMHDLRLEHYGGHGYGNFRCVEGGDGYGNSHSIEYHYRQRFPGYLLGNGNSLDNAHRMDNLSRGQ